MRRCESGARRCTSISVGALQKMTVGSTSGVAITLDGCAAGTHTLACTIDNTPMSVSTMVSL
jgi:hypothetical protein